ncbi:VWA domain-containing protein [Floridanema aerugineum]|uniref:VWA domain-containing protein n=1 Tax=Floridaenema aerugineum BLCC-F46 TaxID=3153654 RepID=A0ABV4X6E1_9CYAN
MIEFESFLLLLFNDLRKQGIPLGISDYLLATKAVREGVGLEDVERLKRFLRLLWAKSKEDQEIFDTAFAHWVKPRLEATIKTKSITSNFDRNKFPFDSNDSSPGSTSQKRFGNPEKEESRTGPQKYNRQIAIPFSSPRQISLEKTESIQPEIKYHLTPRLPISMREMAGIWRHLRRLRREGIPEDLDVDGTIKDICVTGFFRSPVLQPRRRNQVKLVLLIDCEGSMAPFTLLISALQESMEKGGLLGKTRTYYFHDCPEGFLFEQPNLTVPVSIEEVLSDQAKSNSVLIFSDAGAARGSYDGRRLADTKAFLKILSAYTYLYAWLNPVPAARWRVTTAEDIAHLVPMFPLDREGLNDTVKILQGHPFPPGVGLDD